MDTKISKPQLRYLFSEVYLRIPKVNIPYEVISTSCYLETLELQSLKSSSISRRPHTELSLLRAKAQVLSV